MTGCAITPQESPVSETQVQRTPDNGPPECDDDSTVFKQTYTARAAWLDAYRNNQLPSVVSGKVEDLRQDRAAIVNERLAVYNPLQEAVKNNSITDFSCATLTRRLTELAEVELECRKLEQMAWAEYIENPPSKVARERSDRVDHYIQAFIADQKVCDLPPSTDSDALVECARQGLFEGTLAYKAVSSLLSQNRNAVWMLESA